MQIVQKFIFSILGICFLISCHENLDKKEKVIPNKTGTPILEQKKDAQESPKKDIKKGDKAPIETALKKKNSKERDSLKPVIAIL